MYSVTLCNLSADARTATEGGGSVDLGLLPAGELATLLETFAGIDVVQNMKADPEIRIQTRKDRFIVRTGQRKLFLYDARRQSEPAYVLTAEEIIAELDGSAAAKRTVPPIAYENPERGEALAAPATNYGGGAGPEYIPPAPEGSRRGKLALLAATLLLGSYAAYATFAPAEDDPPPALAALPQSERLAEDAALTGVYLTGGEPGHHGLVILGDGRLKLFVIHAQAAPGVVHGTYRIGRIDTKLCLATDQPGGLIKVIDRGTLEYGGESYRRVP